MNDRKAEKIKKLFRQAADAEKDGRSAEAKAFFEKASELSNELGLDESLLREQMTDEERAETMAVTRVRIGEARSRGLRQRANTLSHIVSNLVGSKCNLSANGTNIWVYGTRSMGAQAEGIVAGILAQMDEARAVAQREHLKVQKEKESRGERRERFSRLDYEYGYLGELERLSLRTKEERREYVEEHTPDVTARPAEYTSENRTALALRSKELEVQEYYQDNDNSRGTFRSSWGNSFSGAYGMGVRDGSSANLTGQKAIGG